MVKQWPLIFGKRIQPGWNVGQRFDVQVLVMQSLFTFGNTKACTTVQIIDKCEEPPFDTREEVGVLYVTYDGATWALQPQDVSGRPTVSFRGEQMPLEKILRILK